MFDLIYLTVNSLVHNCPRRTMATKEFEELALDGSNYPTWASDIEIALASRGLLATIEPAQAGVVLQDKQVYTALALLRFYIHKDLKAEYLMTKNPRELWDSLKERYEQQKELIWPEANHEWNHLRLQDFKSVADYNHAVHKICSKLKFCEKEPTDADKIEKTLSTMLPSDRVLQQQYRAKNYQVYSQLIHTLTQAEKHAELLMKNHHKHPVGSAPLPEVHNVQKNAKNKKFNGTTPKNKFGKRKHNKGQRPNSYKRNKDNARSKNDNKCHRCGDFSHFSKNCSAPKHLVALYQKSLKESKHPGGTRYETHFNLASEIVNDKGCSHKEPKEQENNNTLHVEEKIPSTDNMLIDFGSGDMFGDMD